MDDTTRTLEPTIANADLWASYFESEWGRWLTPLGGREVAEGAGARVAGLISLVAAGPIAWLYNANSPEPRRGATAVAERESAPVSLADRREEREDERPDRRSA